MNQTPITKDGAVRLENELLNLKQITRQNIIEEIATARAHGDLKENAEYHAAKEAQSFCEGRIRELESTLSLAQIIDVHKLPQNGRCVFGTTTTILNLDTNEEEVYCIVGSEEVDLDSNKISCYSPIAKALLGSDEGEVVVVLAPIGEVEYEIIEVRYI